MTSSAIYFLAYELRPRDQGDPELEGIGGAFVSAWVKAASLDEARRRAHQHLADSGWTVLETLKEAPVRAPVDPGQITEETWAHYQKAQAEGEVFVLEAFPVESEGSSSPG